MEPRIIVYSDVDGCIIDSKYRAEASASLIEEARLLGVPLIPVSSKTVFELIFYLLRYGLGRTPIGVILVSEEGAAIHASPGLLEEPAGYDPELGLEYLPLSPKLEEYEELVEEAISACKNARVERFTKMNPKRIAELTGLSLGEAYAASKRLYTEVIWSPSRECLNRIKNRAEELGANTFRGKRFLHIALHKGKLYALKKLLEKTPRLKQVEVIVAAGDTELDREIIEEATIGIAVPHDKLYVKPRKPHYTIALEEGPKGWTRKVRETLLLKL